MESASPRTKVVIYIPRDPTLKLDIVLPGQHGQKRVRFHVHGHEEQTVRWLALACSQRLLMRAPHGHRRRRENARFSTGFFKPAEIRRLADGQISDVLDPSTKLKANFKNGDSVILDMGAKFNDSFVPSLAVSPRGEPMRTKFTKFAFHNTQTARELTWVTPPASRSPSQASVVTPHTPNHPAHISRRSPERARVRKLVQAVNHIASEEKTLYKEKSRKQFLAQESLDEAHKVAEAARFQLLMRDQQTFVNTFGLMTEQERIELIDLTLKKDFDGIPIALIIPNEEHQREVFALFGKHLATLNSIFRFYSCYGGQSASNIDTNTGTMSLLEFNHFVNKIKLFEHQSEERTILNQVFLSSNEGLYEDSIKDNSKTVLMRHEFFECLLRLAVLRWPEMGPSSAVARLLEDYVVPLKSLLYEEEFAQALQLLEVQAIFSENVEDLLPVYQYYALTDKSERGMSNDGTVRPTMNLREFIDLMVDSALLTSTSSGKGPKPTPLNRLSQEQKELKQEETQKTSSALAKFKEELNGWRHEAGLNLLENSSSSSKFFSKYEASSTVEPVVVTKAQQLTAKHARICFAAAQRDTDTELDDLHELVFAEFCEALARMAFLRWPSKVMPFKEKIRLAIQCVIGLKQLILTKTKDEREQEQKLAGMQPHERQRWSKERQAAKEVKEAATRRFAQEHQERQRQEASST